MKPPKKPHRRMRGFERAFSLVEHPVREAGQARGFEQTRLLTHWAEIVGDEIAAMARPVSVSYGKGGFGASLTLLTTGPMAPMLQMQTEKIKERVNACYGYAAIKRVHITQTAPTGFAEGQVQFAAAPKAEKPVDPAIRQEAARTAAPVRDEGLRAALERLGANVISHSNKTT